MYAALWRILPGPWWVKLLILLIVVGAILYGLFFYVFPWASPFIAPGDVSIEPTSTP